MNNSCTVFSSGSTYIKSTCVAAENTSYTCYLARAFKDHSSCVGNSATSCLSNIFTDHSVCYANAVGACGKASGRRDPSYDATSYCAGNFCPDGAPSSTAGQVWHREADWADDVPSVLHML